MGRILRQVRDVGEEMNLPDIEAQIDGHRANLAAAEGEHARLLGQRAALLLDVSSAGDAKLDAHDIATVRAARAVERSRAILAKLTAERESLRAATEHARRQATYDEALSAAAEYRRLALEDYAAASRKVVDVMYAMAANAEVVDRANRDLPDNVRAIDVEAFARSPLLNRGLPALTSLVYLPHPLPGEADHYNQAG